MLGSLVPMVPMPGTAAGALGSYLGILVFRRGRDRKIELERERYCLQKSVPLFMI